MSVLIFIFIVSDNCTWVAKPRNGLYFMLDNVHSYTWLVQMKWVTDDDQAVKSCYPIDSHSRIKMENCMHDSHFRYLIVGGFKKDLGLTPFSWSVLDELCENSIQSTIAFVHTQLVLLTEAPYTIPGPRSFFIRSMNLARICHYKWFHNKSASFLDDRVLCVCNRCRFLPDKLNRLVHWRYVHVENMFYLNVWISSMHVYKLPKTLWYWFMRKKHYSSQ